MEKAVSVPFCGCENVFRGTKVKKKVLEGISVWFLSSSWGNPPNKVSTNDFPHVMVMMCCVFDHQSWSLAPNLTISFLRWNYQ